jgi:hypothetical protein
MNNISGRRWARTFLALALFVSVVGNVAHTVLAESEISQWLRVPGAVIWPVFTFGAIEIIVRMIWERSWTHNIARNILLLPAIPAAITSYEHLYSLLLLMGERAFIAMIGPLAIDGMMIGCTMVLLFTRPGILPDAPDLDEVLTRYEITEDLDWDIAAQIELTHTPEDVPVSPAPVSAPPAAPRAPRAVSWDASRVAELVVDGEKTQTVMDQTGASRPTVDRFRKVAKILQADPRAVVDHAAEKLRPEYVSMIRKLVSR